MSVYENYDVSSATYTGLRQAVGWQQQLAHFRQNATPISQQRLMDTGCGTGNYVVHYAGQFKAIHGCDFNHGMLDRAAENLENAAKSGSSVVATVEFSQQDITSMTSVPTESFDALCNNQVLHHLPQEGAFEPLRRAVAEFYRVLKPGGRGVINYSLPEQPPRAFWWAELVPQAMASWLPRVPSRERMTEILQHAGFRDITFEPLYDDILYNPELYFNPRNFLEIDIFRKSDSTFALCSDDEIDRAVRKVEALISSNEIDAWFEKKEEERKMIGQTVNVCFVKP